MKSVSRVGAHSRKSFALRVKFLGLVSQLFMAALVLMAVSAPASAQTYPSKPIHIIVPFGAGGFGDLMTRTIAEKMQASWGQPVVVDNRTGAGGLIGMQYVAKSAPDGYTLVMGTIGTQVINNSIYSKLPYDPAADFVPVAFLADAEGLLVVNPSVPASNTAELIALARKAPGTLFFGSAGAGTTSHLAGELFKSLAKVDIGHVPYKSNVAAVTDVVGGQVTMVFAPLTSALPFVKDNRLKPIATMGAERSALLPKVPTLSESGVAGFEVRNWVAIFAPAGTPAPIVAKLNAEMNRILRSPDVQARMQKEALRFYDMTPEQLGKFVQSENAKWTPIVKASGAKAD
jgi:tripartite-type tricarboxylate transporter receptor subunit TctC